VEECGPCPIFASFTLAFALQMRKEHRKSSVRVRKTSVSNFRHSVRSMGEEMPATGLHLHRKRKSNPITGLDRL